MVNLRQWKIPFLAKIFLLISVVIYIVLAATGHLGALEDLEIWAKVLAGVGVGGGSFAAGAGLQALIQSRCKERTLSSSSAEGDAEKLSVVTEEQQQAADAAVLDAYNQMQTKTSTAKSLADLFPDANAHVSLCQLLIAQYTKTNDVKTKRCYFLRAEAWRLEWIQRHPGQVDSDYLKMLKDNGYRLDSLPEDEFKKLHVDEVAVDLRDHESDYEDDREIPSLQEQKDSIMSPQQKQNCSDARGFSVFANGSN